MTNPFRKASFFKRLLTLVVLTTFTFSFSPVAMAQWDFSEEEEEDSGFSGDDWNFSDEDTSTPLEIEKKFEMPNNGKPVILVFFEPVDETPDRTLELLTKSTIDELNTDEKYAQYDAVEAVPVIQALSQKSTGDRMVCVDSAECMADLARDIGAAKILIGTITTVGMEHPVMTLDLIDIASSKKDNSMYFDVENRTRKQQQAISSALVRLFNLDTGSIDSLLTKREVEESAPLPVSQLVSGIVIGVVALGAIGAGIYFSLQARDCDDKAKKAIDANREVVATSGQFDSLAGKHQKDAKKFADDASSNAMYANIFYAGGAVAAVVSVILFVVRSDKDEDIFATHDDLYINPALTSEGGGVVAGFSF